MDDQIRSWLYVVFPAMAFIGGPVAYILLRYYEGREPAQSIGAILGIFGWLGAIVVTFTCSFHAKAFLLPVLGDFFAPLVGLSLFLLGLWLLLKSPFNLS